MTEKNNKNHSKALPSELKYIKVISKYVLLPSLFTVLLLGLLFPVAFPNLFGATISIVNFFLGGGLFGLLYLLLIICFIGCLAFFSYK